MEVKCRYKVRTPKYGVRKGLIMPIYGEEKTLQMMRSILPSTRRKTARTDKRSAKKSNRAKVRQALHNYDAERIDYRIYPDVQISEIVWERRNADKLSHFERWAVEITKHLPKEERLPYLKRMLPDNLIGRHAYSHLERKDELGFYWDRWDRYRATPVKKPTIREELPELLRKVVENGDQTKLNNKIKIARKYSHPKTVAYDYNRKKGEDGHQWWFRGVAITGYDECEHCEKPRLFLGLGDIESFIADIYSRTRHPEWREATLKFFDPTRRVIR